MSIVILFLAVIAAIAFWWLSGQKLTSKPWLEQGVIDDDPGIGMQSMPAAKIGLGVFLTVVSCFFALLISSYFARMEGSDWRVLPVPNLLWFNTGVLILSSAALQWAKVASGKDASDDVKLAMLVGGFCALLFLVGQLLAWRLLLKHGYYASTNPANAFFYLLTGLHGLHLAGGIAVLGSVAEKLWRGVSPAKLRPSLALCATYWHFLLALWLILLAMLTGYMGDFLKICRAALT